MGKRWIPLESNPDVFNDFSAKIGAPVEDYAFCDVYGMDEVFFLLPSSVLDTTRAETLHTKS